MLKISEVVVNNSRSVCELCSQHTLFPLCGCSVVLNKLVWLCFTRLLQSSLNFAALKQFKLLLSDLIACFTGMWMQGETQTAVWIWGKPSSMLDLVDVHGHVELLLVNGSLVIVTP